MEMPMKVVEDSKGTSAVKLVDGELSGVKLVPFRRRTTSRPTW